jgi:hypothetical protein
MCCGWAVPQPRSGTGGGGLRVWTLIFVLVLLQMTAALRPILGTSDAFLPAEKKFFVSHWTDSLKASGNGRGTR